MTDQALTEENAGERLTGTQRKALRGLAHSLDPIVHVGRGGLSASVLEAIDAALDDHELIKVKLAADRDTRAELARQIEQECKAEAVGIVGTMAILFRAHAEPDKRRIQITASGAVRTS